MWKSDKVRFSYFSVVGTHRIGRRSDQMDKGLWIPKGGGNLSDGDALFDNSTRLEPKRAHQWFLDVSEPGLFPNKNQAVETSTGQLETGIVIPSSLGKLLPDLSQC